MTPIRKMLAILAAMALTIGLVLAASPAQAAGCPQGYCNNLTHWSPDDGYDPAILIKCLAFTSSGGTQTLYYNVSEGQDARAVGCPDAEQVYVGPGQQISCMTGGIPMWAVEWNTTGYHNVGTSFNPSRSMTCVMQVRG